MSRKFAVDKPFFSARGQIRILDEAGKLVYESIGKLMSVRTVRSITNKDGVEVANLTKDLISITSDWGAEGKLGSFRIHKEGGSAVGKYWVSGGKYDGVTTDSGLLGGKLDILKGSDILGRVEFEKGKLIATKRFIELPGDDPDDELIAVILLAVSEADRAKESSDSSS